MILLLLAKVLLALPSHAVVEEHGVGNGGDGMALEFLDLAHDAAKKFSGMNQACQKALPFSLSDFRAKIDSALIESTQNSLLLRGQPVEAINLPEENKILFHRESWARKDETIRFQLVIHEFLGLIGVYDGRYASTMRSLLLVGDPLCSPENKKVADAGIAQDSYRIGLVALKGKANLPDTDFYAHWEVIKGPAGARFLDPEKLETSVDLSEYGEYELRLTIDSPKWGKFTDTTVIKLAKPEPFNCKREYNLPERGRLEIKANDILPLCGGWAYIARGDTGVVELRNLITQQVAEEYHVGAYPEKIELYGNELIVTTASSHIYRINPETQSAEAFGYLAPPNGIAFFVEGKYFLQATDYYLSLFDAKTGKFIREVDNTIRGRSVAYNPVLKKLYGFEEGLVQYSLDLPRLKLKKEKSADDRSTNESDLELSPDGKSLVILSGSGNAGSYGLYHYNAGNVNDIMGSWDVGPYPRVGSFSQDSRYFVTLADRGVKVFSTTDNRLMADVGLPSNTFYEKSLVRLSRDNKIVVGAYQKNDPPRYAGDQPYIQWSRVGGL